MFYRLQEMTGWLIAERVSHVAMEPTRCTGGRCCVDGCRAKGTRDCRRHRLAGNRA